MRLAGPVRVTVTMALPGPSPSLALKDGLLNCSVGTVFAKVPSASRTFTRLNPPIVTPVVCSAARISSTEAVGTACLNRAKMPATWGAAIEVPLAISNPPPVVDVVIERPGASRLMPGARLEKDATASAGGSVVAPTLIADPMQAGADTALLRPSLPEATTVATPLALRSG